MNVVISGHSTRYQDVICSQSAERIYSNLGWSSPCFRRLKSASQDAYIFIAITLVAVYLVAARPMTSDSEVASNSAKGFRLIDFAEGAELVWETEADVLAFLLQEKHFVSILVPIS